MKYTVLAAILVLHLVASSIAKKEKEADTKHFHDIDGDGKEEHDVKFDQDAFLGQDEAKKFSQLDKTEGVKRLKDLIDSQVDKDKDGAITNEELAEWLLNIQQREQAKETDKTWSDYNMTDDSLLSWNDYAATMIPEKFKDGDEVMKDTILKAVEEAQKEAGTAKHGIKIALPDKASKDDKESVDDFTQRLARDERRWKVADENEDGKLSKAEYIVFLYPDDHPKMRKILVQESLETLDKDKDGRISEKEYLEDLWSPSPDDTDNKEPDWLKNEAEAFKADRDKDKDGYLNEKEIEEWLFPADEKDSARTVAKEEADHLFKEVDANKDGKLSSDEILDKYDLFAGSSATNYGDELGIHDEL